MPVAGLLSTKTLNYFKYIQMTAHSVVEGMTMGLHKSPYKTFAIEFEEHRQYTYGDDIKHLDWKVLAKSDKYYIKQYEEDTAMRVYLVLDTSGSMGYKSDKFSKLDYGRFTAAVIAYLMLQQKDSVSLVTCDSKINKYLPPRSTNLHIKNIWDVLAASSPGNDTGLGKILHELANRIKKRGLIIILSDFFDNAKDITLALNHFAHKKHEVIVCQILDKEEVEFPFRDLTKFESLESVNFELVDPVLIKKDYLREFHSHQKAIKETCYHLHIDFVQMFTDKPFETQLAKYLTERL